MFNSFLTGDSLLGNKTSLCMLSKGEWATWAKEETEDEGFVLESPVFTTSFTPDGNPTFCKLCPNKPTESTKLDKDTILSFELGGISKADLVMVDVEFLRSSSDGHCFEFDDSNVWLEKRSWGWISKPDFPSIWSDFSPLCFELGQIPSGYLQTGAHAPNLCKDSKSNSSSLLWGKMRYFSPGVWK